MPDPKLSRTPFSVLIVLAGLYAAQSVTGSMVQTALPVVLRDAGMSLEQIGYLSVLFLPWALKFLWAPLVDRYGSQRIWIIVSQISIALCFLGASLLPPAAQLSPLVAVLLVMAFLAATQDVATDAFGVHATSSDNRATASGASTVGGYLGFLLGGGLWLPVYAVWGWRVSMLVMAGCILMLTIPTFFAKRFEADGTVAPRVVRPGFRAAFGNRQLLVGLGFLVVYQTGIRLAGSMTGPLLVDSGLSLSTIGWLRGVGGTSAGLVAALAGTLLAQRLGVSRCLALAALYNILVCLALAVLTLSSMHLPGLLVTLQILLAAGVAMSFVVLYAAMMNWCSPLQVATDFALLQSADAVLAIVAGMAGGLLGQHFGYPAIFTLSALLLACGALLVRILPSRPMDAAAVADETNIAPPSHARIPNQETYP